MVKKLRHLLPRNDDRGINTIEVVIITPVFLLLIGVLIAGGLVAQAHMKIQHAANEAARAASISRTAMQAGPKAQTAAYDDLAAKGLTCITLNAAVDTSAFLTRPGSNAQISATVTCTVSFDALGLAGIHGTRTITHTATSPLDTYRERTR